MSVLHGGTLPKWSGTRRTYGRLLAAVYERRARFPTKAASVVTAVTRGKLATELRRIKADVVLAHYGPTGAEMAPICEKLGLPLVVHFHGYDASVSTLLEEYTERYSRMFASASGIIAVSHLMEDRLLTLGADRAKTHYCPYGIDLDLFTASAPEANKPVFLAVGRFVEKKAPYLTVLAFAKARQVRPDARLRMIGDGPLLGVCRKLAASLGVSESIEFAGVRSSEEVAKEMSRARAFVQHSVEASDGDSEGTPVAILEASASGLPVISTRHAGITDAVVDQESGILVNEGDIDGMASAITLLSNDAPLAARMGARARCHIAANFSKEASIARLWSVLNAAARNPSIR